MPEIERHEKPSSQERLLYDSLDGLHRNILEQYLRQLQVLTTSIERYMESHFAGRPFLWGVEAREMLRDFFLLSGFRFSLSRQQYAPPGKDAIQNQKTIHDWMKPDSLGSHPDSFPELFRECVFLSPNTFLSHPAVQLPVIIQTWLPEETSPAVAAAMLAGLDLVNLPARERTRLFAVIKENFHLFGKNDATGFQEFFARFVLAANRLYQLAGNRHEAWGTVQVTFRTFMDAFGQWYDVPFSKPFSEPGYGNPHRQTPIQMNELPWAGHFRRFPEDLARLRHEWAGRVIRENGKCAAGWVALGWMGSQAYDEVLLKVARKQLDRFFTSPAMNAEYWRSINVFQEWQPEDPVMGTQWRDLWWAFAPSTLDINDQRHLLKWRVLSRQETNESRLAELFCQQFTWLVQGNRQYSLLTDNGLMELAQWVPHSPSIRNILHSWWDAASLPDTPAVPIARLMAGCLLTEDVSEAVRQLKENPVVREFQKLRPESKKYLHSFFEKLIFRHPGLPRKIAEMSGNGEAPETGKAIDTTASHGGTQFRSMPPFMLFQLHCPGRVVLLQLQSRTMTPLDKTTRREINACLRQQGLSRDTDLSLLRATIDLEIAAASQKNDDAMIHLQTALRLWLEHVRLEKYHPTGKIQSAEETMTIRNWAIKTLQCLIKHPGLPVENVVEATMHPFAATDFFRTEAAQFFLEKLAGELGNIARMSTNGGPGQVLPSLMCMWGLARVLPLTDASVLHRTDIGENVRNELLELVENEKNPVVAWAAMQLALYLHQPKFRPESTSSMTLVSRLWQSAGKNHVPPRMSDNGNEKMSVPDAGIPFLTANLARMEAVLKDWPDRKGMEEGREGKDIIAIHRKLRQLAHQYPDRKETGMFNIWQPVWQSWLSVMKQMVPGENPGLEPDLERRPASGWKLPGNPASRLPDLVGPFPSCHDSFHFQ